MTALTIGGFIGTASTAHAVVHPTPPGCDSFHTLYVGLAQCASSGHVYQALVRCSDGTYRTGPWLRGPSPVWSPSGSCYTGRNTWVTDVWVNVAD